MGFSKEMIEFGWNRASLKELRNEVQATENEMKRMRTSNARLVKDLNSGGFAKFAVKLRDARKEMAGLRVEQERLQRQAARQQLVGQYGRFGGNAAYYTGRAAQMGTPALSGAARGALGLAGSVGAPLALGAMVSRGLSGTAAAAKLDMEFEKLSRHIASSLMPVIEKFTGFISRINKARERNMSGTGTNADKAYGLLGDGRVWAGAAGLAGASAMGYKPFSHAWGAAKAAGRFAMKNPLMVAGGYMIGRGLQLGDMQDRINELSAVETTSVRRGSGQTAGPRRFSSKFTTGEFDKVKDLVGQYNMQDPSKRAEWVKRALEANHRIVSDLEKKHDPSVGPISMIRGLRGSMFGDYQERRHNLLLKRRALGRLQAETEGGEKFSDGSNLQGGSFNPLMMQVAGAGERRDSTGLHQELAEKVAQQMQGDGAKSEEDGPLEIIAEGVGTIITYFERFLRLFNIG